MKQNNSPELLNLLFKHMFHKNAENMQNKRLKYCAYFKKKRLRRWQAMLERKCKPLFDKKCIPVSDKKDQLDFGRSLKTPQKTLTEMGIPKNKVKKVKSCLGFLFFKVFGFYGF